VTLSRKQLVAVHRVERGELLDTLERVGPDAPTLCDGWSATRVASHLVTSEMHGGAWWVLGWRLRSVLGPARTSTVLERGQPMFESAMQRAERPGWKALLGRLRRGPPRLFGVPALTRPRLVEDWIHHEDVRRALAAEPRPTSPVLRQALVEGMELVATLPEFRQARERIRVVLPDGHVLEGDEPALVTVRGEPGEAILALAGRAEVADVTVEGTAELLGRHALAF